MAAEVLFTICRVSRLLKACRSEKQKGHSVRTEGSKKCLCIHGNSPDTGILVIPQDGLKNRMKSNTV